MCALKSDYALLETVAYNVVSFFQGGVLITEALTMPITELFRAERHAVRISKEQQAALKKKG